MTRDPQMVERVARALCDLDYPIGSYDARDKQGRVFWQLYAQAALEASHHAELTALLRDAREALMRLGDGRGMQPADFMNLALEIDAAFSRMGLGQ